MEFENFQYVNIDLPIEEIAKIKVCDLILRKGKSKLYYDRIRYKAIEDIEIKDIMPNVLIYELDYEVYYSHREIKPDYDNIFGTVKILITNRSGIKDRLWREIPDFIEYIIVEGRIYKNSKDKFDFINFELKLIKHDIKLNRDEIYRCNNYNKFIREEFDRLLKMKKEKLKVINELIEEERINEWNIFGETVLYYICKYGGMKLENILLLIEKMSVEAINKWDNKGRTALYWACKNKWDDIAIKLIDRMSDEAINKWDDNGRTALWWTCYNADYFSESEMAIKLIDRMSEEAIKKENIKLEKDYMKEEEDIMIIGETALTRIFENLMINVAMKLIDRMSDGIGRTELILVCNYKYRIKNSYKYRCRYWSYDKILDEKMTDLALKLIDRMNDEVIRENCMEMLCLACKENMHDVALRLIDRMGSRLIDEFYLNYKGRIALQYASCNGLKDVAIEIIDRMSNGAINEWDDNGRTALYWACYINMPKTAIKLIDKMSDEAINKCDINERTALYWACWNRMKGIAIKLIENKKMNVNFKNCYGYTALSWACRNNISEVAIKLIDRMSDEAINIRDDKYKTALTRACYSNMSEVVIKLLPIIKNYEKEIKEDIKKIIKKNISKKGRTILYDYALKNKEEECLRIINYMDKELIEYKTKSGKDVMYWVEKHNMNRLKDMIEKITKYNYSPCQINKILIKDE